MKPRTSRTPCPISLLMASTVLICLGSGFITSHAQTKLSNVLIKDRVSTKHRTELVERLRTISGFSNLTFEDDGSLQLEGPVINGSPGARDLLRRAVSGQAIVVLDDASGRSDVAFCRVVPARFTGSSQSLPAYVVLIDFKDFQQLTGDAEARAAFDVGWGVLHELDHIVADSSDAEKPGEIGECEDHINAMRVEMGLPLRSDYFFTPASAKSDPNFATRYVRLPFERRDSRYAQTKRYWLVWDAATVGGITIEGQRALVR